MAIRRGKGEGLYQVLINGFLVLVGILVFIPLWRVLLLSFTPDIQAVDSTWGLLPGPGLGFAAYERFLGNPAFLNAARSSGIILLLGVTISLFLTVPLAYVLSVKEMPGRKWITVIVLIPFLFNPGLIPAYFVVTGLNLNTPEFPVLAVILPAAVSVYNVFVMRSFFQGIPDELKEAARIDGAGELYILLRIILPLSQAILLTIGLFYGVHYWNDFFQAILYITDQAWEPIPVLLRNVLLAQNFNDVVDVEAINSASIYSMKAASVFLATLPMLIVYPFIQKYFTKGTLAGGIKG